MRIQSVQSKTSTSALTANARNDIPQSSVDENREAASALLQTHRTIRFSDIETSINTLLHKYERDLIPPRPRQDHGQGIIISNQVIGEFKLTRGKNIGPSKMKALIQSPPYLNFVRESSLRKAEGRVMETKADVTQSFGLTLTSKDPVYIFDGRNAKLLGVIRKDPSIHDRLEFTLSEQSTLKKGFES